MLYLQQNITKKISLAFFFDLISATLVSKKKNSILQQCLAIDRLTTLTVSMDIINLCKYFIEVKILSTQNDCTMFQNVISGKSITIFFWNQVSFDVYLKQNLNSTFFAPIFSILWFRGITYQYINYVSWTLLYRILETIDVRKFKSNQQIIEVDFAIKQILNATVTNRDT